MKKSELIAEISKSSEIAKGDVEDVLDALCSVTRDALADGKKVTLVDVGTFVTKERAARAGRGDWSPWTARTPARGEALRGEIAVQPWHNQLVSVVA